MVITMLKGIPSKQYNFRVPAKINHFLRILSRQENGYHNLMLDLIPISLYDEITLNTSNQGIEIRNPAVPQVEHDNVYKALKALEEYVGIRLGVEVVIQKNIPVGSGLGGSSSNAGGVLAAVNRLLDIGLSNDELTELAMGIGADVPFFLNPLAGIYSGSGEQKIRLINNFSPKIIHLIFTGLNVNTGNVFKSVTGNSEFSFSTEIFESDFQYSQLTKNPTEINDFWTSTHMYYNQLSQIREKALSCGFDQVFMSGTGGTLYGVCDDEENLEPASKLHKATGLCLTPVELLDKFNYPFN